MKKILLGTLLLLIGNVCHAEDITIRYNGSSVKVKQTTRDSVKVTVKGAHVSIENLYKDHKLILLLKGESNDGQLVLKTGGKLIDDVTVPFSMKRSASLVSSPAFKLGSTYTVKTKGYEKTFTLSENFTTLR